jgi:hypothetical protein
MAFVLDQQSGYVPSHIVKELPFQGGQGVPVMMKDDS